MALSNQLQSWLMANQDKFAPEQIFLITNSLEKVHPDKEMMINSIKLVDPSQIVLFAWLLGIDGFFIDQVGRSIIKILLCLTFIGALFFIIDAFGAKKRAQEYNFKQFQKQINQLN